MDRPQSQNLLSHFFFKLQPGRILLALAPLLLIAVRLLGPVGFDTDPITNISAAAIVTYAVLIIGLSYVLPSVQENIYPFILVFFGLFIFDLLYITHVYSFNELGNAQFSIFVLLSSFLIVNRIHLLLYLVTAAILLAMVYFLTPNADPGAETYLIRFGIVGVAVYFIGAYRINRLETLVNHDLGYQRLIENLNEGVMQMSTRGVVTMVNEELCRMTGYSREALMGPFQLDELIPKEDQTLIQRRFANNLQGQSERYEIRVIRKDRSILWVSASASPTYNEEGDVIGNITILSDITAKKEAELALDNYSQTITYTNQELAIKNANLEQFAEMASSDLRAPIDLINESADILRQLQLKPDPLSDEYFQKIESQTQQMSNLLDALLVYSSANAKNMHMQEVDFNEIIREVEGSLVSHMASNNAKILFEELPNLEADRIQMLRLFRNLIENAIKYRGEDAPIIHISFSLNPERNEYIFAVEDNGIGIRRDEYDKIFQIFRRDSQIDAFGLGMGLAVSKKIVANHNGRLWFTSNVGKGTTFFFSLPAPEIDLPSVAEIILEGENVDTPAYQAEEERPATNGLQESALDKLNGEGPGIIPPEADEWSSPPTLSES
ncbi:MAG: ATP-binding protein [Bacteroidota bacterium]